MTHIIEFPEPPRGIVVEMELLRRTISRTLAVHHAWPLVVWSGPAGNGKTTTARYLVRKLEEAHGTSPHGFRGRFFTVSDISGPHAAKRFLRAAYHALIGRLAEGAARSLGPTDLAQQIVDGLQLRGVQLVAVDEAGLISETGLRGVALLRDVAEERGWPLTIVLVGMDQLPTRVRAEPQVKRRVAEWCFFEPYALDDTWRFLQGIHPHFAALTKGQDPEADEQVQFLHDTLGGLPGHFVPFLRKVDAQVRQLRQPISLRLLRAVHLLTTGDETRTVQAQRDGYRPPRAPRVPPKAEEPKAEKPKAEKAEEPSEQGRVTKAESEPATPSTDPPRLGRRRPKVSPPHLPEQAGDASDAGDAGDLREAA